MNTRQFLGLAALGFGIAAVAALVREEHRETRRVLTTALRGVQESVQHLPGNLDHIVNDRVEQRVSSEQAGWLVSYLEAEDELRDELQSDTRVRRLSK